MLIVESYDRTPFSWDSSLEGPYEIQIFREDNALVPLMTQQVLGSPSSLPLPGAGNYYWQVGVLDRDGNTVIKSEQTPFRMADKLEQPEIQLPQADASLSVVGDNALEIQWLPVPGGVYYNAELIPANRNFPTLRKTETSETSWIIEDKSSLRVGDYTLKVQAFNRIDEEYLNSSDPSLRRLSLSKVQGYSKPVLVYPAQEQDISRLTILEQKPFFRWTQSPPLPIQQIRVSRDPGFSTTVLDEQLSTLNRVIPDLPIGTYYLQLLSQDREGNDSPPSSLYTFHITAIPSLPTPGVSEPVSGAVIDMQEKDELNFRWTPVNRAEYYDLKLKRNDKGSLVFHQEKLTATGYTFNRLEDLDVGGYTLEIQAFREKDGKIFQQSDLLSIPFELTLPEITVLPEILSPELQYAR